VGWLALATLSAFAVLVPVASADTALPVWTCRGSAAYVELDPLLGPQRIEPIVANGFADRNAPDAPQCTHQDQGVPNVTLPPPAAGAPPLSLTLQAPFARTNITPALGAARDQTVTATGGVVDPLRIQLGNLVIEARAISAQASATCVGTTPTMTASSTVVELSINGNPITIPTGPGQTTLDLSPLLIITFNEKVAEGTATSADQALTQRALHIQVLPSPLQPAANIVVGEAKVDRHGAVCAPPPPPPACPPGSVPQTPGATPLVCILTVVQCAPGSTQVPGGAPGTCVQNCPAGSSADPATGACVIVRQAPPVDCPAGSTRDPATNNCVLIRDRPCPAGATVDAATNTCVLIRDRPCPAGATPDPATSVCVQQVVRNVGSSTVAGENGRVGSSTGPVATCGRLEMHFVRGGKRTLTNRFGNRVVTRGRLVTCGSNPRSIVGARIDVVHVLPDGRRLRKTGLRSRAAGRLTLILPLDLRSRRLEYSYRPDLRRTRVTSRVTLRLTVRDRNGRVLNK
jgi:hypothetical protein